MSHYITSEFNLASALLCSHFTLNHLKREGEKGYFHFEHTPELNTFIDDYFSGRVLVNPVAYSGAQKQLKNYLFNSPN